MKSYYTKSPYSRIDKINENLYYVHDLIGKKRHIYTRWFTAQAMRRMITSRYSKVKTTHTV